MLTDRLPKQVQLRTEYQNSGQLRQLDLPTDDRVRTPAMQIKGSPSLGTVCTGPDGVLRISRRGSPFLLAHETKDSGLVRSSLASPRRWRPDRTLRTLPT
jgi:hypothetical protein